MTDDRRQHIERQIEEHGLTMKAVSLRAGKGETFVRDMLKRDRSPSADNLNAVEAALADMVAEKGGRVVPKGAVPNLLINAGMGNGGLESIEVDASGRPLPAFTDGAWSLPEGIAVRMGQLSGIYALPVAGDSMMPTIAGGSVVFIDTKHTRPSPPGIFMVDYGDGLLVKRVELIGGTEKISIASDNPAYRDYEFERDEVTIWGRVIGRWSWMD